MLLIRESMYVFLQLTTPFDSAQGEKMGLVGQPQDFSKLTGQPERKTCC